MLFCFVLGLQQVDITILAYCTWMAEVNWYDSVKTRTKTLRNKVHDIIWHLENARYGEMNTWDVNLVHTNFFSLWLWWYKYWIRWLHSVTRFGNFYYQIWLDALGQLPSAPPHLDNPPPCFWNCTALKSMFLFKHRIKKASHCWKLWWGLGCKLVRLYFRW